MADKQKRTDRELDTREKAERAKLWAPPNILPDPKPEEGYEFRYIRVASMGKVDATNVSAKLREGWVPVLAKDHEEIELVSIEHERFKDNIVIGGLMLCKAPSELVAEREAYYKDQADRQMQSVDNNLMRENDPRMPLFNERDTEVTFGKGT